jgi:hypothetical protein
LLSRGALNIFSALVSFVGREDVPLAEFPRLADDLRVFVPEMTLRDVLAMPAVAARGFKVGPQCRCCPAVEWARADLLMAHVQAAQTAPGGGGIWFKRVADTYRASASKTRTREVVHEADRLAWLAQNHDGAALLVRPKRYDTSLDRADIVVGVPSGSPQAPLHERIRMRPLR